MMWLRFPHANGIHPEPTLLILDQQTPLSPQWVSGVKRVVGELAGVGPVEVQVVMSPPWNPARMTEEARDELGIFSSRYRIPISAPFSPMKENVLTSPIPENMGCGVIRA